MAGAGGRSAAPFPETAEDEEEEAEEEEGDDERDDEGESEDDGGDGSKRCHVPSSPGPHRATVASSPLARLTCVISPIAYSTGVRPGDSAAGRQDAEDGS